MSRPSEVAYEAAERCPNGVRAALRSAHDPSLGLDRSVCLRDVVAWLRTDDGPTLPDHETADAIEREFGGKP